MSIEFVKMRMREQVKLVFLVFAYSSVLVFSGASYAQQPANEQQKFMSKCNPQQKAELQKACHCLMQSVDRGITLAEYNRLEERDRLGQVNDDEMRQKARLIAGSKAKLAECMRN